MLGDRGLNRGPCCEVIRTAAAAPWVAHSDDGGQLISCHTRGHIYDFCEIIFGFPGDSPCPVLGPDCSFGHKTQEKHVQILKMSPQKPMRMCNNTQRPNLFSLLFHPMDLNAI